MSSESSMTLDRTEVRSDQQATSVAVAYAELKVEERTQMRRMLKEAANAVGGAWPTSELQAVAVSGARNLAIVSRTTTPVWAAVTWRTTFLERLRRSALSQFDGHDCDAITGLSGWIRG